MQIRFTLYRLSSLDSFLVFDFCLFRVSLRLANLGWQVVMREIMQVLCLNFVLRFKEPPLNERYMLKADSCGSISANIKSLFCLAEAKEQYISI